MHSLGTTRIFRFVMDSNESEITERIAKLVDAIERFCYMADLPPVARRMMVQDARKLVHEVIGELPP